MQEMYDGLRVLKHKMERVETVRYWKRIRAMTPDFVLQNVRMKWSWVDADSELEDVTPGSQNAGDV